MIKAYFTYATLDEGTHDFGIRDEKGRAVGYKWVIQSVTATPVVENDGSRYGYYILEDNHPMFFFEIDAIATRDGVRYGASNRGVRAKTLEEARRLTVKKIEAAGKSYAKKYRKEVAA